MGVFIAVIAVLAVMIGFFFFIFRGIVLRVGRFAQNNVLRQSGVFDELILKKEQTLLEVQKQLEEAQAKLEPEFEIAGAKSAQTGSADYLAIPTGNYKDPNFANEYRQIRDHFMLDRDQRLREVIAAIPAAEKDDTVSLAREIVEEIDLDASYALSTLTGGEQAQLLLQLFSGGKKELLERYLGETDEFECYEFLSWLRQFIFENSADIIVRTGREEESFNALDGRIQTQFDDSICEGIYVVSKGKKYDFSIRNREIIG